MSLGGKWYNELNSSIDIQIGEDNTISGIYHNAAGAAKGDYNFTGVVEPVPPGDTNQAIAWVVTWVRLSDGAKFQSVTAWSGQYQLVKDNETNQTVEKITALWLLTVETVPDQDWKSTQVGQDVFTRIPAHPETVKKHLDTSAWSHPKI